MGRNEYKNRMFGLDFTVFLEHRDAETRSFFLFAIVIQSGTKWSEDVLLRACPKNLGNIHFRLRYVTEILRFALNDNRGGMTREEEE